MKKPQLVQTKIVYKKTKLVCPDAPKLQPLKLRDIKFIVATDDEGLKVMGLSADDYEVLADNTGKILLYIKQQTKKISYYKHCIDEHNKVD